MLNAATLVPAQNWFWFRSSSPGTSDSARGTSCRNLQESMLPSNQLNLFWRPANTGAQMKPCILTTVFGTDEATLGSSASAFIAWRGLIAQNTNTKLLLSEDGAAAQLLCLWRSSVEQNYDKEICLFACARVSLEKLCTGRHARTDPIAPFALATGVSLRQLWLPYTCQKQWNGWIRAPRMHMSVSKIAALRDISATLWTVSQLIRTPALIFL